MLLDPSCMMEYLWFSPVYSSSVDGHRFFTLLNKHARIMWIYSFQGLSLQVRNLTSSHLALQHLWG